jgi:NADH dehydrogenase
LPDNRLRVAADWFTNLLSRRQVVQFGLVPEQEVSLAEADGPGLAKSR